ncbi:unnamed protein product [Adineta steineri]|uniref:Sialin n=1 Tax=Adineta steineri TaxID=433720 RepID=A0A815YXV9_9BILA|nr:unnamed protein product [Adineta steineri]CAF1576669.1 unnamed protein product [Adineta steineri]
MRSQPDTRRSTSALLYDENEKTIDAILDQQPLLGYTDIDGDNNIHEPWHRRIFARHIVATWTFFGFLCLYMLRVNLSVAIVAMTTPQSATNQSVEACPSPNDSSSTPAKHGDFDWDPRTQGHVLGSFFYGYILSQFIGGILAERFGAKWIFGCGLLGAGLLTLLSPIAAKTHVGLLIATRVLIGVFEGPAFPAAGALWSQWVPPLERSIIPPIAHAGKEVGVVVTTPLAGILCASAFLGGWPSSFYVFGVITCIWFIFWCFFAYNSPSQHPRCSKKERDYITAVLPKPKKLKTPWLAIATSIPFWSIAIASTCVQFVYYVLLTSLPTYFATILRFNLQKNGFMFAIPYVFMMIVIVTSGQLADHLRARKIMSTTAVRKLQTIIGGVGSSLFLVLIGYVGCSKVAAMFCITLAVAFIGFHSSGCQISHLDIASNYAGTLVGITNTLASIPGFVGPAMVGAITNNNQTLHAWQTIFNLSAGIGLFGCIVYCIFFDGNEQSWNRNDIEEITEN